MGWRAHGVALHTCPSLLTLLPALQPAAYSASYAYTITCHTSHHTSTLQPPPGSVPVPRLQHLMSAPAPPNALHRPCILAPVAGPDMQVASTKEAVTNTGNAARDAIDKMRGAGAQ